MSVSILLPNNLLAKGETMEAQQIELSDVCATDRGY